MFVVHLCLSAMTPLAGNRKDIQSFTPFRPWYVACVWITARLLQPVIKDQVHRSWGQITQNAKTAARFFTAVKTAVVIPKYLLGDPGRTEVTPEGRPVKHRNEYSQSYSIGAAWIWHHGLAHTHTRLTALFPWLPGYASTRKVNLSGFYWSKRQWVAVGHVQVCTLLQTDNHASTPPLGFLQAGCPSCRPTNSVKALKAYHGLN